MIKRYVVQSYFPDPASYSAYRVWDEILDVPISGPYGDLDTAQLVADMRSAEWSELVRLGDES